jgi:hydrogenase maturation protease
MVLSAMADLTTPDIVVLGCGNPNRSDDGAGPRVIAMLREAGLPAQVRLFDVGTDGMTAMYRARGATHLVVVDARVPGGTPGAVYEVPGEIVAAPPAKGAGLHEFRWDHALYAGHRIYGTAFPATVVVLLIEAETLDLGLSLSPAVEAATVMVADRVRGLVDGWLGA